MNLYFVRTYRPEGRRFGGGERLGKRRLPRGGRLAVVAWTGASCLFFSAGATTATAGDITLGLGLPRPAAAETSSGPPPLVVPTSPDSWFRPEGNNQGTEGLVGYLSALARQQNPALKVTSGWGRTEGPVASDHHLTRSDSWANDLAVPGVGVPTEATQVAAERIGSALGEPGWRGGNLVKTINGYRFQVLWLVADHFDHVHVGVRKVA